MFGKALTAGGQSPGGADNGQRHNVEAAALAQAWGYQVRTREATHHTTPHHTTPHTQGPLLTVVMIDDVTSVFSVSS
jgi:hypothetical protein